MALIKCPECGKDVSENAISCPNCGEPIKGKRLTGEIDSGTESFSITEGNRLKLSASANARIKDRCDSLSKQGMNVINVHKSEPQPLSIGFTFWTMDITIVWNASLDNPTYKEYLYNQAKTLIQQGIESDAVTILKRITTYRDSQELLSCAEVAIKEKQIQKEKQQKEKQQQIEEFRKKPRNPRSIIWPIGIFFAVLGIICPGNSLRTIFFVIGAIIVAIGEIVINSNATSYSKRLEEYYEQKAVRSDSSAPNRDIGPHHEEVPTDETQTDNIDISLE